MIKKSLIFKYMIVLILMLCIGAYHLAWESLWSDNASIQPIHLMNPSCYAYTSDQEVINIAKYAIATRYGEQEIKQQRRLKITHNNHNEYWVMGEPNGFLQEYSRYRVQEVVVELKKDKDHPCLAVIDVYKFKD